MQYAATTPHLMRVLSQTAIGNFLIRLLPYIRTYNCFIHAYTIYIHLTCIYSFRLSCIHTSIRTWINTCIFSEFFSYVPLYIHVADTLQTSIYNINSCLAIHYLHLAPTNIQVIKIYLQHKSSFVVVIL